MKHILITLACLIFPLSVSAENWIALPMNPNVAVDTDSYTDSGLRTSIAMQIRTPQGATISTLEFDKEHDTYRVAAMENLDNKGNVKESYQYSESPDSWSPLLPNSFGKSMYTHLVENPLPHFNNPVWLNIYTENGVRFHGGTYDIEKNTITYKNGYATFWLRLSYPWKDQDFSAAIYQVRMDIPNKRVQTLSMTEYNYDGKIKSHGAGGKTRDPIAEGTPMEKAYQYIKHELDTGHIRMVAAGH